MMKMWRIQVALGVMAGLCVHSWASTAPQQTDGSDTSYPHFSGAFEAYGLVYRQDKSTVGRERFYWLSTTVQLSPAMRVVGGVFINRQYHAEELDEFYIGLGDNSHDFRFGRMRPAFGLIDWYQQWLVGFINLPLVQVLPVDRSASLTRIDSGADVRFNKGALQLQAGLFDSESSEHQLTPNRADQVIGRAQAQVGELILGASAMLGPRSLAGGQRTLGLDLRWTHPQWQVRSEYVWHEGSDRDWDGYYADVLL